MADIFSGNNKSNLGRAGRVILSPESSIAFIDFKTFNDVFNPKNANPLAIIQQVNLDQGTNHQFTLSLRQTIYLYVYGNLMGDVRITGILFAGNCDGSSDGFTEIVKFYNEKRVSSSTEPVEVIVGKTKFKGYLTALGLSPIANEFLATPFSMTIKLLPGDEIKKRSGDSGSTGSINNGSTSEPLSSAFVDAQSDPGNFLDGRTSSAFLGGN